MIKNSVPNIELQINICVHKQNLAEIEELGGFLQEHGVDRWKLRRFAPINGRGKRNKDEFYITEEEYEKVLNMKKEQYPILILIRKLHQILLCVL